MEDPRGRTQSVGNEIPRRRDLKVIRSFNRKRSNIYVYLGHNCYFVLNRTETLNCVGNTALQTCVTQQARRCTIRVPIECTKYHLVQRSTSLVKYIMLIQTLQKTKCRFAHFGDRNPCGRTSCHGRRLKNIVSFFL